jgi:hypothetical protein
MVKDVKWDEEIKKRSSAYSTAHEKSKLFGGAASTEIPLPESIKRMCYLEVNADQIPYHDRYVMLPGLQSFVMLFPEHGLFQR